MKSKFRWMLSLSPAYEEFRDKLSSINVAVAENAKVQLILKVSVGGGGCTFLRSVSGRAF